MIIKRVISTVLLLGVLVTTPTYNAGGLDLPAAVADVPETSPTVTRVGVVSNIVESDNITVKISGSPTLVNASYLFPQYQPMIGDRVIVQKTDAQWLVLGTASGTPNTLTANPSFELGTTSPSSWAVSTVNGGGGVPTFTRTQDTQALVGSYSGAVNLTPAGVGTSELVFVSDLVPASPGSAWTGGIYLRILDLVGPNSALVSILIRWYNSAGVSIGLSSLAAVYNFSSTTEWRLLRPDTVSLSVSAPAGTAFAALEIQTLLSVNDSSTLFNMMFDYAILRSV